MHSQSYSLFKPTAHNTARQAESAGAVGWYGEQCSSELAGLRPPRLQGLSNGRITSRECHRQQCLPAVSVAPGIALLYAFMIEYLLIGMGGCLVTKRTLYIDMGIDNYQGTPLSCSIIHIPRSQGQGSEVSAKEPRILFTRLQNK